MGFRTGSYCSIWSVEEGKGNSMKVRLSISRKNKETNQYDQEFAGFCLFIGTAKDKAKKLKQKDRIKLGDVDVTNYFDKGKGVEYVTYKVFDFELIDGGGSAQNTKASAVDANPADGDVDEENLPF